MSEGDVKVSAWIPEKDPHVVAVLAKLGEEANELSGRALRCIMQGIDEIDPETKRTNRAELVREVTDVMACMALMTDMLDISIDPVRMEDKFAGYLEWHRLIDEATAE